jgi:hypothetical protein
MASKNTFLDFDGIIFILMGLYFYAAICQHNSPPAKNHNRHNQQMFNIEFYSANSIGLIP